MAAQPVFGRALLRGLLFVGAVGMGLAAVNISRRFQQSEDKAIDWNAVRRIAAGIGGRHAVHPAGERAALEEQYRAWIRGVEPKIAEYLKTSLPRPLETIYVFDRTEWIDANVENFRALFAPLEEAYGELMTRSARPGSVVGGVNQLVMSSQVGLLLGYLSKRVLGQYDMALLGREPVSSGKLYFVEQNIRETDSRLHIAPDQFRLWICLHEATHAFEFEAHPWLAVHLNSQIARHMAQLTGQVRHIHLDPTFLQDTAHKLLSGILEGDHWLELLMSEEQRGIFRHLQALMSLLEGYSNHVMDHIGVQYMADYQVIKQRFEHRRSQRGPGDRLFGKLTGLDLKMEQYSQGERFVNYVVGQRGIGVMNLVWRDVDMLPNLGEIRHPQRWIDRVEGRTQSALALSPT